MKENENKELDELIGKAMKSLPLETPSLDFTAHVMARTVEAQRTIPQYKPLLPNYFWLVLAIGLALVLGYAYFAETPQEAVSSRLNLKETYGNAFHSMTSAINFSRITLYATVALLLAMLVQIPIIRSHFERKGGH